ncbi:MAG: DUF2461 domain-containing protein [Sporichthyaceae bacterium]
MAFTGFPTAALDFYDDLETDNSKSFWTAHKHIYDEAVKAPMEALVAEVAPAFGAAKLFRPYRDVRFAADKTPYKTHQGAWFDDTRVYVQISAEGLRVAAGYWRTTSAQVERLRRAVDDDASGPALVAIIATLRKKGFDVVGEALTRVPAGYAKDHERADLLRHKTLTTGRKFGFPDWLATPRAKTEVVKGWKTMAPLVAWLDTYVGTH